MLTIENIKRNEAWPVLRVEARRMWDRHVQDIAKIDDPELEVALFTALIVERQRFHHFQKLLELTHVVQAQHRDRANEGRRLAKLHSPRNHLLTGLTDGMAFSWVKHLLRFDVQPYVMYRFPQLRPASMEQLNDMDQLQQAFALVGNITQTYWFQTVRSTDLVARQEGPDDWLVVKFDERVSDDASNCTDDLYWHASENLGGALLCAVTNAPVPGSGMNGAHQPTMSAQQAYKLQHRLFWRTFQHSDWLKSLVFCARSVDGAPGSATELYAATHQGTEVGILVTHPMGGDMVDASYSGSKADLFNKIKSQLHGWSRNIYTRWMAHYNGKKKKDSTDRERQYYLPVDQVKVVALVIPGKMVVKARALLGDIRAELLDGGFVNQHDPRAPTNPYAGREKWEQYVDRTNEL